MLKKIIYNLEEFAQHLVNLISDGSLEGIRRLDTLLLDAKKEYTLEDSAIWSSFYSWFRDRGEAFNKTALELQTFPDPLIRLQEFKKFISEGEWYITSANTRLLIQLINALPGYQKEEDSYLHKQIIPDLIHLIKQDIEQLIKQHAIALAEKKRRDEEIQRISDGKPSALDMVILCDNPEDARRIACEQLDKRVFSLTSSAGKWQLQWFDFTGKASELKIGDELSAILLKNDADFSFSLASTSSRPPLSAMNLRRMKLLIDKTVNEYLDRTNLLINPPPANEKELVSSFIIEGQQPDYKLYWVDSIGVKQEVEKHKCQAFSEWLSQQGEIRLGLLPKIKTWLQHVDIRRDVDEVKLTNVQKILQKKHGITLLAVNDFASVPRYKLLPGTYFLTQEEGCWVLYLRQKGGMNTLIDLSQWPRILYQLEVCKDFLPESIPMDKLNRLKKSLGDALEPETKFSNESEAQSSNANSNLECYRPPAPLREPQKMNKTAYGGIISILEQRYSTITNQTTDSQPRAKLNLDSYSNVIHLLSNRHAPKPVVEELQVEQSASPRKISMSQKMHLEAFFGSGRRFVPEEIETGLNNNFGFDS